MENNKILGIIGVHYPYAATESFFHEELVILSQHFTKIIVFLTDIQLIKDKKVLFAVPKNIELVELDLRSTLVSKIASIRKFNYFDFSQELKNRNKHFSLRNKFLAFKTIIYYENRAFIFEKMLNQKLIEKSINASSIILYSYWLNENTYGLVKLKRMNNRFQIYSRAHGWDVYEERHIPPFLPLRKNIIPKLDGLFTVSEQGKKYLINTFQLEKTQNIHVAYMGTAAPALESIARNRDKLEIITIAYLAPIKNIELLIEVLSKLNFPFRWTHIGDQDREYDNQIKKIAFTKIPSAKECIQFLGIKTNAEIKEHLSSTPIDVLVNTSFSEGIPVSLMEALSNGIPVIGPNVGGISEIITAECGILLSQKPSPFEIIQALETIYKQDKYTRIQMKEASKLRWLEKFNAKANYTKFANNLKGNVP